HAGGVHSAAEHDPGADLEAVGEEDRAPRLAVRAEPLPERRPVRPRRMLPDADEPAGLGERPQARCRSDAVGSDHCAREPMQAPLGTQTSGSYLTDEVFSCRVLSTKPMDNVD